MRLSFIKIIKSTVTSCFVFPFDFYVGRSTVSKSGIKSTTFTNVRFSSIANHSDVCHTVSKAQSSRSIHQLYRMRQNVDFAFNYSFISFFLVYRDFMKASCTKLPIYLVLFYALLPISIGYQPEDGILTYLKRPDLFMDCSLCSLS